MGDAEVTVEFAREIQEMLRWIDQDAETLEEAEEMMAKVIDKISPLVEKMIMRPAAEDMIDGKEVKNGKE